LQGAGMRCDGEIVCAACSNKRRATSTCPSVHVEVA
jgi:hypothetical protein